ncbi:unnamed protein product [Phytophthora fragariaefolia]|uniref:Unnamed protein product n=1 Tax=Phytophthora fragariaefolia TaxID=1490495 RepID=A0A9W6Y755_9STRA|nr:unnamed protein product [Phytophthora fragariaefolia]
MNGDHTACGPPEYCLRCESSRGSCIEPIARALDCGENILRYVEGTKEWGLVYRRNTTAPPVQVYTDADWANNEHDRKSISGVLVQVFGCSVSWQTKRQRIVSKSSTIAEYIAADDGVEEAHWVHLLLRRLTNEEHQVPIPAMIDNKSTIKRLLDGRNSDAQKTVDCRFFAVRDAVTTGILRLQYCPTTVMLADCLTKALGVTRLHELRKALGVMKLPLSDAGEVLWNSS